MPFLLLASLASSGLKGQDDLPGQTNGVVQSEAAAASDSTDSAEVSRDDDATGTNTVAETNQVVSAGPDAHERRLLRQRRPRTPGNGQNNGKGSVDSAGTNSISRGLDYAAFRLVAERNIFNPNRSARSSSAPVRPKTVESFTLVGTMSYEKGVFAFFDGTSSDYRKAVKPEGSIAGYTVLTISPESVKLMLKTNVLELAVGTQMRRREDGVWERSEGPASYANTSTTAAPSEPSAGGAESDIIKKMMQRREKE